MSDKRRIYLLKRDHTMQKSKKTLAKLKSKGALQSVQWVLIPIQNTSATYIAVDADTISITDFGSADIRFHMKLKNLTRASRASNNALYETTLWDYYTTTIHAESFEEFYNALYNILIFHYIKELYGNSDSTDTYWFLDVVDLEINIFNGRKKIDHFYIEAEQDAEDVPFDYEASESMSTAIINHFGLAYPNNILSMPNLYFRTTDDGMRWYERNGPVELYSTIDSVLWANIFTRSYVMLTDDQCDVLTRMRFATLYISPIDMTYFRDRIEMLPIAAYYGLKKYDIRDWRGEEDLFSEPSTMLYHDFGSCCMEIFSIQELDTEQIPFMIDNLYYIAKSFHEATTVNIVTSGQGIHMGEETWTSEAQKLFMPVNTDLDPHYKCTVLINMVIELGEKRDAPDDDSSFIIYTDPFEDEMPRIDEVAYLLELDEHPF